MRICRRLFLMAGTAAPIAWQVDRDFLASANLDGDITPEQFGARGDGVTDDTTALARLAAYVSEQGGGRVVFRRTTYLVGVQAKAAGEGTYSFEPAKLLEFVGCTKPLFLLGNGARLKCANGLRYGTFDRSSGAATQNSLPFLGQNEIATPYRWMIKVEACTGSVEVRDLELDGNLEQLKIGGPWGDTGHQINAIGIALINNYGSERLVRIHSHHHGQDGLLIDGADLVRRGGATSLVDEVRCEFNGRQGCSIVGGRGYNFQNCKFNHTGRAGVASNPGAGVDIEAEAGKQVRQLIFSGCEFSDNYGQGVVADSGDSKDVKFIRCRFVGTTNWSVWPNKPFFRFNSCTFVGPIVRPFGATDGDSATQFHDCVFRDDPSLSPTGKVYGGENPDRPIGDLPNNHNVLFNRCSFRLTHDAVLPWSVNVTYSNCSMSQRADRESYPRGLYIGRNSITGRAVLQGSKISGEIMFNGSRLGPGSV